MTVIQARSSSPRIVHVINSLSHRGGVMRGLSETLPRLNRLCGHHSILCLQEGGSWAREFEAAGVGVYVLPMVKPSRPWRLPRLLRWIGRQQVDLLHLRMPETVLPVYFARLLGGAPYIVQGHGLWDEYWEPLSGWRVRLHQHAVRRANALTAVSQTVADAFRRDLQQVDRQVHVISNGVSRPGADFDAASARRRIRQQLGISPETPLVGLVGRPCKAKRHIDFVRAAGRVLEEMPAARFVIVGHGKEKYVKKMNDAIEELRLRDVVWWVGDQPAIHEWMAALDVGVLCSEREGFGLALVEYLEHELPVVATDIPAFRELVRDGETALLAEPCRPESLAARILEILQNPMLAATLRRNARSSVAHLTWDRTAEKMADLYRNLFGMAGT